MTARVGINFEKESLIRTLDDIEIPRNVPTGFDKADELHCRRITAVPRIIAKLNVAESREHGDDIRMNVLDAIKLQGNLFLIDFIFAEDNPSFTCKSRISKWSGMFSTWISSMLL